MNEDEKITAFRELVKSIKENSKYLSEDFDPDTELEKGKKKNIQKQFEEIWKNNGIQKIKKYRTNIRFCSVLFLY